MLCRRLKFGKILIEEKRKVIDAVADGIEPMEDTSIMSELIDRLLGEDKGIKAERIPMHNQNFTAEPNEFELF